LFSTTGEEFIFLSFLCTSCWPSLAKALAGCGKQNDGVY